MDFSKIKSLIEKYRVLTGLSSLPFVVDVHGCATICWFNYFLDQCMSNLNIAISDVFTLADDGTVSKHKVSGTIQVVLGEYDEPQMKDNEYISQLEKIYEAFSCEQMDSLLHAAEMSPLLPAYEKVSQLLKEESEE